MTAAAAAPRATKRRRRPAPIGTTGATGPRRRPERPAARRRRTRQLRRVGDGVEDAGAQRRRWRRWDRVGEDGGCGLQIVELGLQIGSGAQHVLQLRSLLVGEGTDGEEGQLLAQLVVGHDEPPIVVRSRIRPSLIRVFDGAERDTEPVGDLDVRQPVVEGELERFALRGRQRGHRGARPGAVVGVDGVVLRRRRDLERGGADGRLPVTVRLLAAHTVDGAAMSDHDRPRADARPGRVEAGRLPPDLHEDLLRDLLGLGRVAQHPAHDAVDGRRQEVVQRRERGLIAVGDPGDVRRQVLVHACTNVADGSGLGRACRTRRATPAVERHVDRRGQGEHAEGSELRQRTDARRRPGSVPDARQRGIRRSLAVVVVPARRLHATGPGPSVPGEVRQAA